jgi:hypothetical protein
MGLRWEKRDIIKLEMEGCKWNKIFGTPESKWECNTKENLVVRKHFLL